MEATSPHWIVSVARIARLPSADDIAIPLDASPEEAWQRVLATTRVSAERLTQYVADHFELEVADVSTATEAAALLLPSWIARELGVLPLSATDARLVVATADPGDLDTLERLGRASGRTPRYEVASPGAIAAALDRLYPPAPGAEPSAEPAPRASTRVLVVDDDEDTRLLLRAVLESQGFEVDEASDGAQAIDMLDSGGRYDLMTLDLYMGAVHGLDVLRHVRAHVPTASLSVLVTTGSDDPAIQMKLLDAGADDYIVKPVDPPRFVLRVQAVLRRRAKGRSGLL